MASRAAGKTPLETVDRSVFENQLEAFKIVNQEISKVFGASAAFAAIKPKGTAGFLSQYNTYVLYLDEMISHFNKNKEIARKNQRNERLEIDCTPFLIFERSITRVFAMLLSKQKKYKNELNAISILLTPLRELVKIINENQINEINLLRFEDIEKIDIDLFYFIKEKADAMAKYNIEMTRSTTDALCNYEKNNKGRIEKLRAKEHFQVDMFQDQVVYYGITTSYLDLISRYENKSKKKFPPSQQLIYLPPIRRESSALRALPLRDEAARSASPVPNIPRIRASEIQTSVPMLPSGRPTQTPPRSPVHARILSKSRSSRRIGQSSLTVAATSTTPIKTPPAENQPRALPDMQQAPIVAPDEPTHADSQRESQEYAAPDEQTHVDSQRESQASDVQRSSETNPDEPERTASNPPDEDMKEENNETIIDKNIKPKLFKATEPLEHLEKDRISLAEVDKKPEESVDNEEEDMVIDKDIGTEPIENNDVEAEKDIKEDDVEESSEDGASEVHDQGADEVNPPKDVDPTPSPSVSPPPSEADEPKSSESQIGDGESRSPGTSDVGNRGDSDSVTSKDDRSVDGVKEVDVESSESSESPERDDLPVQREAESDQENRDEEDSGDADSSNPNYSNNDESQEAPESPRQVPVASPQADDDSEDGENSERAVSSDSEDDEEPAAQPEYPEDPASLDAENNRDGSEAVAVGDSSSSEDTVDDSEEPEAVEEPDAPEELPVQVPEVSPREEQESSENDTDNESEQASDNRESQESAEDSGEEQPEEDPRGDRESSEDDTDDVSEQASDNRVSAESAEESSEEKAEEVPGDEEEEKTDVDSSGGESQGSPESPASPEEPIQEDEPSVDPVDPVDSEESLESLMSPEPESNERSVPIQEDPQPVVGAVSSIDTKEAESCGTLHKRSAEPVEPEETPQKKQKLDDSAQRSPEHPME